MGDRWGHEALWETGKVYTWFWWGELMEGDHLEDLDVGEGVILFLDWLRS